MSSSTEAKGIALRRAIIGAIVVASFLPMALVLWVVHSHLNVAFQAMTHENLQSIADWHSVRINTFVEERLANIRLLAANGGPQLLDPAFLAAYLKSLRQIYGDNIVDMGLVDDRGIQRVYAGSLGLDLADYSKADWLRAFREQGGSAYVSNVFLGLRKTPHFIVAVRVEIDGKPFILRATVDFARFSKVVGEIRVAGEGKACIINREGQYQTPPLEEPYESGAALAARARQLFGESFGRRPVERTLDDGENLYAMSLLTHNQWILILRIRDSAALAAMTRAEQALYITLVLISLGVFCGGLLLSWRLLDRINRLERERLALNEHLVQAGKLSALGEMAAGIAHEINNPVAIMMEEAGWIEDVAADMPRDGNTAEIVQSVGKIRSQGARCRTITHKLLGFARKSDEPDQAVDVGELLHEMAALTDQKARNSGVSIAVSVDPGLPPVNATPSVLQQIFLNLFNNAVDAMEGREGGSLRVTAAREEHADSVRVSVSDTGPGIPDKIMARIFDPFFTTKPAGKGTGLGLSICYGIVKGLGGDILVESRQGEGATFHVVLPVHR
ncbi:MAG: two-component sensor histidine kinase [Desulfovibrionaceae bacterium]|nr:two-component sensor histidine kinase [Desulfovibrionaceae bacterium]